MCYLGHEAVLRGEVYGEVHDGDEAHAEGAVGGGEGAGHPVEGAQVRHVAGAGQHHGAQGALQAGRAVGGLQLGLGHHLRVQDHLGLEAAGQGGPGAVPPRHAVHLPAAAAVAGWRWLGVGVHHGGDVGGGDHARHPGLHALPLLAILVLAEVDLSTNQR